MNTENSANSIIASKLSTVVFYLSVLFFIIGFNFTDVPPGPFWVQQFMPNLNGQNIADITFTDSLNGFAVTNLHYILKTTNSGNNWSIVYNDTSGDIFKRVKFLNKDTGFVGGSIILSSLYYILETTNAGINWFYINAPFQSHYQSDISVLNNDTIWTVEAEPTFGGVFFTSNGGVNWIHQLNIGSGNPDRIYMFNARIGFTARSSSFSMYKTTNSGANWSLISNIEGFNDMYFLDSLTGWKAGPMKKTTNGGLNWTTETMPSGGMLHINAISSFSNLNSDTIWGNGGYVLYPNNRIRSILNRTTNGGDTWYFQVPDTTIIDSTNYIFMTFTDQKKGWATDSYIIPNRGEIHTTNGGDTTFYLPVKQISSNVPTVFRLYQNYPNPFNPRTVIKYDVTLEMSNMRLIVYDINGRIISTLVDQRQNAGTYEVDFNGSNYSTGIYFYQLTISNEEFTEVYKETKKMIMVK